MQNPDRPAVSSARDAIAHLQQSVHAWVDGDQVMPADGAALLAALDTAALGLAAGDMPAGRTGIERFTEGVQGLIEGGVLAGRQATAALEEARQLLGDRSG